MAASDHLQPKQLAFLMPAHEVMQLNYGDASKQTPSARAGVLEQKHADNEVYGPPKMDRPIRVYHDIFNTTPNLGDGHHRLAHALVTDPSREMLVVHDDEKAEMIRNRNSPENVAKLLRAGRAR